ncbi:hypothetical protein [Amycolatopsis sp. lyj-84]|uniref:hypothetical protein n=1 Tax=Amycolatopsis sp. lyj-84 TaxID=2789284 RepID=UPI00397A10CC
MQTVLISALTAAMVTLLIEYVAKPRLETRKDRIVEAARVRRDVRARMLALSYKISLFQIYIEDDRALEIEVVKAARAEAQGLADDTMKLERALGGRWMVVVQPLVSVQYRLGALLEILDRASKDGAAGSRDVIDELIKQAMTAKIKLLRAYALFIVPRWRVTTWKRAASKAESEADSLPEDPVQV